MNRKIRLIIDRNKYRFSDEVVVDVDRYVNFMCNPIYSILNLNIPKWMREMLDKDDFLTLEYKISELSEDLWFGKDGMEVLIKI